MASHKSAIKQNRKDLKRRTRNRAHRSTLRTVLKRARIDATSGKPGEATTAAVGEAIALLDRKAAKGIIHRNAAARTKSRLLRQAAKAAAEA